MIRGAIGTAESSRPVGKGSYLCARQRRPLHAPQRQVWQRPGACRGRGSCVSCCAAVVAIRRRRLGAGPVEQRVQSPRLQKTALQHGVDRLPRRACQRCRGFARGSSSRPTALSPAPAAQRCCQGHRWAPDPLPCPLKLTHSAVLGDVWSAAGVYLRSAMLIAASEDMWTYARSCTCCRSTTLLLHAVHPVRWHCRLAAPSLPKLAGEPLQPLPS